MYHTLRRPPQEPEPLHNNTITSLKRPLLDSLPEPLVDTKRARVDEPLLRDSDNHHEDAMVDMDVSNSP